MNAAAPFIDPKAQAGKFAPPDERFDLVVIGAGAAGTAAAIEAAAAGASVLLVDEHPVGAGLVGLDVPYLFGGRASAAVNTPERLTEQVLAAAPRLEAAFEAGVDVRLGTACFGLFQNGPGAKSLPAAMVGLTDGTRSWMAGFGAVVVATGARDLVTFFEGSDMPGVVGALGLTTLLQSYDAFVGRRIVVLGSDALAAETALACKAKGLEVAALVEVEAEAQAPADRAAALIDAGIPILARHVILAAATDATGVTGAVVAPVGGGEAATIACDTICLALGRVPVVDVLEAAGAAVTYADGRGGFVPVVGADGVSTSLPGVFAAGDCTGVARSLQGEGAAEAHGRTAARAALAHLGRGAAPDAFALPAGHSTEAYRLAWMSALTRAGGLGVEICRCEEVTRAEFLGVRPPRYLGADTAPCPPLEKLAEDGVPNQDQLKRLTRAGMGVCQGRRCREQIALTIALATDRRLGELPLAGYRAPVRPLPLQVVADWAETEGMTDDWDVWFGIPTQWVPYADIGTEREIDHLRSNMHL